MIEKTVCKETLYEGRILGLEVQEVELENGKRALREIIRHGGAVAVLARRPDGKLIFVRQYRKPVEREMFEVVAGNREKGESAEACARRELKEETGYLATSMVSLGYIHPSPGYVDERIDLFFAETEAECEASSPDEDEHLEVLFLDPVAVVERIRNREIADCKTLAVWVQYAAIVLGQDVGMPEGETDGG